MASTSKNKAVKQTINNAGMANCASKTSKAGSNSAGVPSLATDAPAGFQATLEKTMQEMAQISNILRATRGCLM